jgi:hypothetical protein
MIAYALYEVRDIDRKEVLRRLQIGDILAAAIELRMF